jgi:hypothetical protein
MSTQPAPEPRPDSGIVWLASYPKSGNTWTRTFLANLVTIMAGEADALDINSINRFSLGESFVSYYKDILGYAPTSEKRQKIDEMRVHEVWGSSEHVESWTRKSHPAIYIMRYEVMLSDPETTFGKLARHLLLNPIPAELKLAIERSSFEAVQAQEDKEGFREKPEHADRFFREGRAGQWKNVLSPQQVNTVVSAHREQMERFGYLPP